MPNPNRPAPGSSIAVEPIRRTCDIKAIKKILADKPRDLALFTLGINTNLRASDLVALKAGDVQGLGIGDALSLKARMATLKSPTRGRVKIPRRQKIKI